MSLPVARLVCGLAIASTVPWTAHAQGESPETRSRPAVVLPTPIPVAALDKMPDDATAYCADGTWTNNVKKPEACAGRGGVKTWFGPAPAGTTGRCKDGTYTRAKKGTYGACSGYGGVKVWFSQRVPPAPSHD